MPTLRKLNDGDWCHTKHGNRSVCMIWLQLSSDYRWDSQQLKRQNCGQTVAGYRNDTVTKWKIDSTKYLLTYWVEFDFSFLVLSFSNFVYLSIIHQTEFVTSMIKLLHQKSQEWRISNNPTAHSVSPPYLSRPNSPTSFIFWVVLFFSYAICDDFFQENNLTDESSVNGFLY